MNCVNKTLLALCVAAAVAPSAQADVSYNTGNSTVSASGEHSSTELDAFNAWAFTQFKAENPNTDHANWDELRPSEQAIMVREWNNTQSKHSDTYDYSKPATPVNNGQQSTVTSGTAASSAPNGGTAITQGQLDDAQNATLSNHATAINQNTTNINTLNGNLQSVQSDVNTISQGEQANGNYIAGIHRDMSNLDTTTRNNDQKTGEHISALNRDVGKLTQTITGNSGTLNALNQTVTANNSAQWDSQAALANALESKVSELKRANASSLMHVQNEMILALHDATQALTVAPTVTQAQIDAANKPAVTAGSEVTPVAHAGAGTGGAPTTGAGNGVAPSMAPTGRSAAPSISGGNGVAPSMAPTAGSVTPADLAATRSPSSYLTIEQAASIVDVRDSADNALQVQIDDSASKVKANSQQIARDGYNIDALSKEINTTSSTASTALIQSSDNAKAVANNAATITYNTKQTEANGKSIAANSAKIDSNTATINNQSQTIEANKTAITATSAQVDRTKTAITATQEVTTGLAKTVANQTSEKTSRQVNALKAAQVEHQPAPATNNTVAVTHEAKARKNADDKLQSGIDANASHADENTNRIDANRESINYTMNGIGYTALRQDSFEQKTNQRFAALSKEVNDNKKEARSGIANAVALAGLPQVNSSQTFMVSAAAGTFANASAIAVGGSANISQNVVVKFGVSDTTEGNAAANVGFGIGW